eukprot:TRINITY_DN94811_c0_g1_i1.p2 TRINITY_DN94811_c0_g1~~TRINITY_DN94811_c0_g1_i1.p2  ORF type:complete len:181 (-),score=38.74 TRINITY_DN94811_c0_g1_i1:67-609(-)
MPLARWVAKATLASWLATSALGEKLATIIFKAESKISVSYVGRHDIALEGNTTGPDGQSPDFEQLLTVLEPAAEAAYTFAPWDSFVVRAGDMRNRVKIVMYSNDDEENKAKTGWPYKISFKNIMLEGEPLELAHSPTDFTWIEPGSQATHGTDFSGLFTIKDKDKQAFVSTRIDYKRDEL